MPSRFGHHVDTDNNDTNDADEEAPVSGKPFTKRLFEQVVDGVVASARRHRQISLSEFLMAPDSPSSTPSTRTPAHTDFEPKLGLGIGSLFPRRHSLHVTRHAMVQ
jgi:hypothetical protein